MSPYGAYFLGLFTFILIVVPFWVMSIYVDSIKKIYKSSVCYKICQNVDILNDDVQNNGDTSNNNNNNK